MSFPIAFLLIFTVGLVDSSAPAECFSSHRSDFFVESSEGFLLRISSDGLGGYVETLGEETL
jgi:hypothetical protein